MFQYKATEIPGLIKEGKITATELTEAYLKKIKEKDGEINAYITVMEKEALERAKAVDEKVKRGEPLGKLAGIPISLKDNIAYRDVRMTCASKMLENFLPPYDATVTERILEEDGIVLGKTNMDEFATGGDTKTSYFGVTRNPLDLTRVAGGSSGGSAASVAGEEALLSVGTDTGGSVREPAAFCGLVGVKPTYGSISRSGIASLANTFDQPGVFAHSVEEALLLLQVLAGKDGKDATSLPNEGLKTLSLTGKESLKGLKIAIPDIFKTMDMDPEILESFENGKKVLKEEGAILEEVHIKTFAFAIETYHILMSGEVASNMSRYDGLRYGYRAEDYDTVEELYMKSRSQGLGEEIKRRILIGTFVLSLENNKEFYQKAMDLRELLCKEFDEIYKNYDLVLTPTFPRLAYLVDQELSTVDGYAPDMHTVPVNLAGLCGITLPVKNSGSLPGGIQLIGNRFEDDKMLKAAYALERSLKK